ncbi:YncE family protein [Streptomyces sp. NPDC059070]|uniref:YncE family protein n=1 Tax=Streptomyces sp. NPDC059070 TaxID=3346713 RepID=UPI0036C690CB
MTRNDLHTHPRGAARDLLAVASQSGPSVTFLDAVTHGVLGAVEVPAEPHELCFDPVRRLLYATITYRSGYYNAHSGRAHELAVIDPDARRVVEIVDLSPEQGAHGVLLDPVRDLVWLSVEGDPEGALVALDPGTREIVRRVPVGAPGPHWFVVAPDGRRAYSANKEAPYLSVVDLETGEFLDRVPVPGSEGIDISADGRLLYAAVRAGDGEPAGVRVIDTATHATVRVHATRGPVFPVHVAPGGLVLAGELRMRPDGSALGANEPGLLHLLDADGRSRGQVPVGAFPLTVRSSPDGALGLVSAVLSSTVTVVDLVEARVVRTLEIPRAGEPGAHGLAYIPAPGAEGAGPSAR